MGNVGGWTVAIGGGLAVDEFLHGLGGADHNCGGGAKLQGEYIPKLLGPLCEPGFMEGCQSEL